MEVIAEAYYFIVLSNYWTMVLHTSLSLVLVLHCYAFLAIRRAVKGFWLSMKFSI